MDTEREIKIKQDIQNLEILKSGTGRMMTILDAIEELTEQGYTENLVPHYNYFSVASADVVLHPRELVVDDVFRFENASDPDDNSILYAISNTAGTVKGLYIDSFGIYHDDLSKEILESLRYSRLVNKAIHISLI